MTKKIEKLDPENEDFDIYDLSDKVNELTDNQNEIIDRLEERKCLLKKEPPKRWKPERLKEYYFIDSYGEINCDTWMNDESNIDHYKFRNCFPTEAKAKSARDKIRNLLQEL